MYKLKCDDVGMILLDNTTTIVAGATATSSKAKALQIVGILGNITSFFMFFSPLPTFWQIYQRKATGKYSGVPYIATLLNCLMWTFYGSGSVASLMLVLTINVAGVIIESLYIGIHLLYGDQKSRRKVLALFFVVFMFFIIVLICVIEKVDPVDRATVVGSICVVIGSLMYSSPMTAIATVVKDKSVESMPFSLSATALVNSTVWTIYGIIATDVFVIIPNGLGVIVCVIQLTVYMIYYKSTNIQEVPQNDLDLPAYSGLFKSDRPVRF